MLLQLTYFDFTQIAMDTIASFEGQCSAKNIKIKLTHEDKPYMVSADQLRIQQVIYNLIDNAIKFSPNNADLIVDLSDKGDKVFVSVKDFGVGISPENQVKIFDRFYKVDDSRGKDKKGTGLGLAIVKEIITAHNENINVISTEGVGTQFVFSLAKAKK
jgi:signal transduction histidine kinase